VTLEAAHLPLSSAEKSERRETPWLTDASLQSPEELIPEKHNGDVKDEE